MEPLDLRVWILKSLREAQRTTMAEFLKEDVSRSATRSNSALSCKSTYRSVPMSHSRYRLKNNRIQKDVA